MSAIDLSGMGQPSPEPEAQSGAMWPPATIRLKDGSSITTRAVDNIQPHPLGLFVTGFAEDQGDEVDWLVSKDEWSRIEFDFNAVIGEPDEGSSD